MARIRPTSFIPEARFGSSNGVDRVTRCIHSYLEAS
jgi:hypothetical protein